MVTFPPLSRSGPPLLPGWTEAEICKKRLSSPMPACIMSISDSNACEISEPGYLRLCKSGYKARHAAHDFDSGRHRLLTLNRTAGVVTLFLILSGPPVWAQNLVDGSSSATAPAQSPDAVVARGSSVSWLDGCVGWDRRRRDFGSARNGHGPTLIGRQVRQFVCQREKQRIDRNQGRPMGAYADAGGRRHQRQYRWVRRRSNPRHRVAVRSVFGEEKKLSMAALSLIERMTPTACSGRYRGACLRRPRPPNGSPENRSRAAASEARRRNRLRDL